MPPLRKIHSLTLYAYSTPCSDGAAMRTWRTTPSWASTCPQHFRNPPQSPLHQIPRRWDVKEPHPPAIQSTLGDESREQDG